MTLWVGAPYRGPPYLTAAHQAEILVAERP